MPSFLLEDNIDQVLNLSFVFDTSFTLWVASDFWTQNRLL
jgi:hypothetical protein